VRVYAAREVGKDVISSCCFWANPRFNTTKKGLLHRACSRT
jgi:hypothetical protein